MSKGRAHGRILEVTEETLGSVLAADAVVGATVLYVDDAADFEDDGTGGTLSVNGQVVDYTDVDDDTGQITLKDGLTAAADEGDSVDVWSKLYDEAATLKSALVMVDGWDDNTDPIVATLADAVQDLPEGLRGEAGENCTLHQVSPDEWEVTAVGGRPSSTKGASAVRFEADDYYTITADDVAAGTAVMPLSHAPCDEGLVAFWAGAPQRPTDYSIDYEGKAITWPLAGFEKAGDVLWVHYAYLVGVRTEPALSVPIGATWKYATNLGSSATYADPAFDDSGWASATTPIQAPKYISPGNVWTRIAAASSGGNLFFSLDYTDNETYIYLDGTLIYSRTSWSSGGSFVQSCPAGDHVIAVYSVDTDGPGGIGQGTGISIQEQ